MSSLQAWRSEVPPPPPPSIQKVLTSSKEEVDVLVKNYQSTSQLASFLVVLRRDYDALKASKASVKKEKDKLAQDITYFKRKVSSAPNLPPSINPLSLLVGYRDT